MVVSDLCKSGFIKVEHVMRGSALKLFHLHREYAHYIEGGLGVRVTVQLNLFSGSVANLGSIEQQTWLSGVLSRGELGCFILTERGAGVLSGLMVETTATWTKDGYVLDSPEPLGSSRKTWISQGLVAKWGVVIARLLLPGVDKGPHAFVIEMSTPGILKEDMLPKTEFNGLDNAMIWFEKCKLPHSALLSGISSVNEEGAYLLTNPKVPFRFEDVAQRLLSGRICIAGAALCLTRKLINDVEAYAAQRPIPTGRNQTTPLSELPCMRDLLADLRSFCVVFRQYVLRLENSFMKDTEISAALVHRIACAKVLCIEFAIRSVTALKERVGSFSLLQHGPFGAKNDLLYVFRFAEGDSGVLCQKMVRDALRTVQSPLALVAHAALRLPLALLSGNSAWFSYGWDLLTLVLDMSTKSRTAMVPAWLEAHALVERIGRKLALLTVYEDVQGVMAGSRELEVFKRRYIDSFGAL